MARDSGFEFLMLSLSAEERVELQRAVSSVHGRAWDAVVAIAGRAVVATPAHTPLGLGRAQQAGGGACSCW